MRWLLCLLGRHRYSSWSYAVMVGAPRPVCKCGRLKPPEPLAH